MPEFHDANEYVVAYVDEEHPKECGWCMKHQIVGLRQMRRVFSKITEVGFICLSCIAEMWNNPSGVPMEPSADAREAGTPILEQSRENES